MIDYKRILQENKLYDLNEIPRTDDMKCFQEIEDAFGESGGGYFIGLVHYQDNLMFITNVSGKIVRYIIDPETYPHYDDSTADFWEWKDLEWELETKVIKMGKAFKSAIAWCGIWKKENIGTVYIAIDPDGNSLLTKIADSFINNKIEVSDVEEGDIRVNFDNVALYD